MLILLYTDEISNIKYLHFINKKHTTAVQKTTNECRVYDVNIYMVGTESVDRFYCPIDANVIYSVVVVGNKIKI